MTKERLILITVWIIVIAAMLLLLRRNNWRRFAAAHLMAQNLTWINGLIHCQLGVYAYPVREFPKATDMGFTMQYLFYPTLCGFCILFEPNGGLAKKILYILCLPTATVIFRMLLMRYTRLIVAADYHILQDWVTLLILFLISRAVTNWIFRDPAFLHAEEQSA
ncbi:CBO0543 family protein [Paenibacillus sp. YN15]|uniref:CBO0543 family protein n=1 Tax=Paenibacillus sp. YN15 TaxID=1742774 RepID=UPI000DCF5E70|nr:CBO0543 family protein [Paenibacillus sp. YN15]RAU99536.1 hypothetical protein DQG13_15690 [Paenibacillus sp. YN15]